MTGISIIKKISKEVIDYLINNPNTSRDKITSIKIKIGKKYY